MILSCGELLIDFIGSKENPNLFEACPGGSPYNTAMAAGRLGAKSQFFSRVSRDLFGQQLVNHLKAQQVGLQYLVYSDDPTILSFVKMDEKGKPAYAFFPNGCADRMMQPSDMPYPLPPEVQAVQVGSISLVLEPGASSIVDFLQKIHSTCVISYDPNIRAGLIPDHQAYVHRFEQIAGWADIIKLSDEDLEWLYPNLNWQEGLDKILSLGTSLVAFTQGEQGAVIKRLDLEFRQPVVSFGLGDTVGAGDTFHGALLAYLQHHDKLTKKAISEVPEDFLRTMAAYAAKAAGINCSRVGADPPWEQEMNSTTFDTKVQ